MDKELNEIFGMVTIPTVTAKGLKTFATILKDKSATKAFFYQEKKMIVGFLSALQNTEGAEAKSLLVNALSSPMVVYGLLENGQVEFVLDALKALNSDQITQIFSEENCIYGLIRNHQSAFVFDTLETMNSDQITQILSAPNAVWALAYNDQAKFAVDTLNKLNNDQIAQIFSASSSAMSALANNGYRDWVRNKRGEIAAMKAQQSTAAIQPPKLTSMG